MDGTITRSKITSSKSALIGNNLIKISSSKNGDILSSGIDEIRHPLQRISQKIKNFGDIAGQFDLSGAYHDRLSGLLGKYTGLPEENIAIFTGPGKALRNLLNQTNLSPGENILISDSSSESLEALADLADIPIVRHEALSPFAPDPEGIVRLITDQTKIVYLSSPNVLTGTVYASSDMEFILRQAQGATVVVDESLHEYCRVSAVELIKDYDNLVILRTFCSAFELEGAVCEYILTGEHLAGQLNRRVRNKNSSTALAAGLFIMEALDYEKRRWESIRENMLYLALRLRMLGISSRITPANFLLIRVQSPGKTVSYLKKNNVKAHILKHNLQLEDYISLRIIDEKSAFKAFDCFSQMPRAYIGRGLNVNNKMIFKRPLVKNPEVLNRERSKKTMFRANW